MATVETTLSDCDVLSELDRNAMIHGDSLISLQPTIFWYDSNHLAHVHRYLEIFSPYENLSTELRAIIGKENIKNMFLRYVNV
jgi:hypothetical protein